MYFSLFYVLVYNVVIKKNKNKKNMEFMLCIFAEKAFPRTHKSEVRERNYLKDRIYACLFLFRTGTNTVTCQGCDKDKHLTKLD